MRRTHLAAVHHGLSEEEVEDVAKKAHAFVAADLAALVSEAAMTALRRCVVADQRRRRQVRAPLPPRPLPPRPLNPPNPSHPAVSWSVRCAFAASH